MSAPPRNEEAAWVLVNFRATPDERRRYREAARALGVSISDVCRTALEELCEQAEELERDFGDE